MAFYTILISPALDIVSHDENDVGLFASHDTVSQHASKYQHPTYRFH
jgi:hypothetical protein